MPLSLDILAMHPNGISVRCFDCAAVSTVCMPALPASLRVMAFATARVIAALQVAWHPFGTKCQSCDRYMVHLCGYLNVSRFAATILAPTINTRDARGSSNVFQNPKKQMK